MADRSKLFDFFIDRPGWVQSYPGVWQHPESGGHIRLRYYPDTLIVTRKRDDEWLGDRRQFTPDELDDALDWAENKS